MLTAGPCAIGRMRYGTVRHAGDWRTILCRARPALKQARIALDARDREFLPAIEGLPGPTARSPPWRTCAGLVIRPHSPCCVMMTGAVGVVLFEYQGSGRFDCGHKACGPAGGPVSVHGNRARPGRKSESGLHSRHSVPAPRGYGCYSSR